jgi:hypothetical protein
MYMGWYYKKGMISIWYRMNADEQLSQSVPHPKKSMDELAFWTYIFSVWMWLIHLSFSITKIKKTDLTSCIVYQQILCSLSTCDCATYHETCSNIIFYLLHSFITKLLKYKIKEKTKKCTNLNINQELKKNICWCSTSPSPLCSPLFIRCIELYMNWFKATNIYSSWVFFFFEKRIELL